MGVCVCGCVRFRTIFMVHRSIQSSMSVAALGVLLICCLPSVVNTFNLDIAAPEIRTGPADSLFGFSVAVPSRKNERYDYGNVAVHSDRFDTTGSMLAHLERYSLENNGL